jgi:hypothetical protein
LYNAGPWNGNRPYRYDLDDPSGLIVSNKLLPAYLANRKGNCVSMPMLFVILGKKLGLDVAISTAPKHFFVKYRGDDGHYYNFEATSNGPILDASIRREFPMTEQALANGIYMRPWSNRETIVGLVDPLTQFYMQQHKYQRRIALADLVLEYFPKEVMAMLHKSAAYRDLIKQEFVRKYPFPGDIPPAERSRYDYLRKNMELWREKAEALGWRLPDETSEANYLQSVQRAKLHQ